jgi:hypothetical protein
MLRRLYQILEINKKPSSRESKHRERCADDFLASSRQQAHVHVRDHGSQALGLDVILADLLLPSSVVRDRLVVQYHSSNPKRAHAAHSPADRVRSASAEPCMASGRLVPATSTDCEVHGFRQCGVGSLDSNVTDSILLVAATVGQTETWCLCCIRARFDVCPSFPGYFSPSDCRLMIQQRRCSQHRPCSRHRDWGHFPKYAVSPFPVGADDSRTELKSSAQIPQAFSILSSGVPPNPP